MRTLNGQLPAANVDQTDPTNYPQGRVKDGTSTLDATPVVESVSATGDVLQAMYKLIDRANLTPNENPENDSSSQINDALDDIYYQKNNGENNAADIGTLQGFWKPHIILIVQNGVITSQVENGISGTTTLSTGTLNTTTVGLYRVDFQLSIESGATGPDYYVSIEPIGGGSWINADGLGAYTPVTYEASHSNTGGTAARRFNNNSAGNIRVFAPGPAGPALGDFNLDFKITIFKAG